MQMMNDTMRAVLALKLREARADSWRSWTDAQIANEATELLMRRATMGGIWEPGIGIPLARLAVSRPWANRLFRGKLDAMGSGLSLCRTRAICLVLSVAWADVLFEIGILTGDDLDYVIEQRVATPPAF